MLSNDEIYNLSQKIDVVLDPEVNDFHRKHEEIRRSIVDVILKSGKRFTSCVDVAKGWASRPLTKKEVEDKFRTLASATLDEEEIDVIIEMVCTLERQSDVRRLIDLLK